MLYKCHIQILLTCFVFLSCFDRIILGRLLKIKFSFDSLCIFESLSEPLLFFYIEGKYLTVNFSLPENFNNRVFPVFHKIMFVYRPGFESFLFNTKANSHFTFFLFLLPNTDRRKFFSNFNPKFKRKVIKVIKLLL